MESRRWDDSFLDGMRAHGDPPADEAVRALLQHRDRTALQGLLDTLTRNDDLIPAELPLEIQNYFSSLPDIPAPQRIIIDEGQQLFADYGPEMLMILACYSLPAAYAARKGVQVLYRTGFLSGRPNKRLFQTAQMVVDVMTPGGLGPNGRGRVTAQKVRLMHAAIRYLLQHSEKQWPLEELGTPINQEDLAGTLLTFSSVVLDGLYKLRIEIPQARADAYLAAWQAVGRILGVVEELIPASLDEANDLMRIIRRRQVEPSPEGQAMTAALLELLASNSPPGFARFSAALMRTFLPSSVADDLGVPEYELERTLVETGVLAGHLLDHVTGGRVRRQLLREFSLHVIALLIRAELRGRLPAFRVPTELGQTGNVSAV